jgi:hypothetical protein
MRLSKLCAILVIVALQGTLIFATPGSKTTRGSEAPSFGDTTGMKVLVPAYFDPSVSDGWKRMAAEAAKMPGRIYAIANLNNGPGSHADASYTKAIGDMHTNGGRVIGYVYTNYGAITLTQAKADIDAWFSYYPSIDGIFLDCQSNQAGKQPYYQDLYQYIKQKDSTALVVGNPGINTIESYLFYNGQRVTDVICIFESYTGYDTWTSSLWCSKYSRDNFYVLPYNTTSSDYVKRVDRAVAANVGWIYCTDDNGANPWDTLPLYFEDFCGYVATGVVASDSGYDAIKIDGSFNDWLTVPKLDAPPNPLAVAGDSPDSNADYIDFWATNDSNHLYISYQVAGTLTSSFFYRVFIGTDSNSTADFRYGDSASTTSRMMIENDNLWRYTGTGGVNWSWTQVSQFAKANVGGRSEMSIPFSVLPQNARTIRLLFQIGRSTAPYAGMEIDPADYKNQFYAYTLARVTGLPVSGNAMPSGFALDQNYPNPFNPTTVISGQWTVTSDVRLGVYDVLGREVAILADARYPAGKYSFTFNAKGLASAVYFYRLTAGNFRATKAMLLVR